MQVEAKNDVFQMTITPFPQNAKISYLPLDAKISGIFEANILMGSIVYSVHHTDEPKLHIWWDSKKSSLYIVNPKLDNVNNQSSKKNEEPTLEIELLKKSDEIKFKVDLTPLYEDLVKSLMITVYERSSVRIPTSLTQEEISKKIRSLTPESYEDRKIGEVTL